MERTSTHNQYLSSLRELGSERLYLQVKHAEALLASPGWAFLEEQLVARRQRALDRVIHRDNPGSEAEVAKLQGLIRGIDEALQFPRNVLNVAEAVHEELSEQADVSAVEA